MARYSDLQREVDRRSVRLEAQLHDAELDPCRDKLERKLGQIRVAPKSQQLDLLTRITNTGIRPPQLALSFPGSVPLGGYSNEGDNCSMQLRRRVQTH
jgi:hypothetical protein